MSDDYLAKSGVRDLLTAAIAELLAVRPGMPLSFLTAHFQSSSNKIGATAHILRASHLRNKASFQDAVMKAYQTIGTSSTQGMGKADSGSSLKTMSTSIGTGAPPLPPVSVRNAKPTANGGDAQQMADKTLSGTTLDRRDFAKLLEFLCEEFPKNLQQRALDALENHQLQPQLPDNSSVPVAEFQRSVEVCLLFEELVDVVEDLFRSIDKGETGEVRASAFLLALETAAATQDRHTSSSLLAVLKAFVLPSPPSEDSAGGIATTPTAELFIDRTLRLADMYDAIFHLVFQP